MSGSLLFEAISIPSNLDDLLHALAQDVLLERPKNIYEFAVEFFERRIQERDEGNSSAQCLSASFVLLHRSRDNGIRHVHLLTVRNTFAARNNANKISDFSVYNLTMRSGALIAKPRMRSNVNSLL